MTLLPQAEMSKPDELVLLEMEGKSESKKEDYNSTSPGCVKAIQLNSNEDLWILTCSGKLMLLRSGQTEWEEKMDGTKHFGVGGAGIFALKEDGTLWKLEKIVAEVWWQVLVLTELGRHGQQILDFDEISVGPNTVVALKKTSAHIPSRRRPRENVWGLIGTYPRLAVPFKDVLANQVSVGKDDHIWYIYSTHCLKEVNHRPVLSHEDGLHLTADMVCRGSHLGTFTRLMDLSAGEYAVWAVKIGSMFHSIYPPREVTMWSVNDNRWCTSSDRLNDVITITSGTTKVIAAQNSGSGHILFERNAESSCGTGSWERLEVSRFGD